jgi:DNA-binding NarL/FixJ family response regulator
VISVFLCDDEPTERFLLGQSMRAQRGLYPAGAASSAVSAIPAVTEARPDVVVLDHLDHDGDVSVMVRAIRQAVPAVKVVLYSGLPVEDILGADTADRYVRKTDLAETLWAAIYELFDR